MRPCTYIGALLPDRKDQCSRAEIKGENKGKMEKRAQNLMIMNANDDLDQETRK